MLTFVRNVSYIYTIILAISPRRLIFPFEAFPISGLEFEDIRQRRHTSQSRAHEKPRCTQRAHERQWKDKLKLIPRFRSHGNVSPAGSGRRLGRKIMKFPWFLYKLTAYHGSRVSILRLDFGDLGQIKSAWSQNNPPFNVRLLYETVSSGLWLAHCWRREDATSWNMTRDRLLQMGGHCGLHSGRESRSKMFPDSTYSALRRLQKPTIRTLYSSDI